MVRYLRLFLLFLVLGCSNPPEFENVCDPESKNFFKIILFKSAIGDRSPSCGFNAPPSSLNFSASYYTFTQGKSIGTVSPSLSGNPTSCTASPSLPAGITLDSSTCALSGTPTQATGLTTYTITASNSAGNTSGTVSIRTLFGPPKYAYIAHYGSNNISMYTINSTTGALTANGSVASGTNTRDIVIDPTGKFLYSADMGTDNIRLHTINQTTGTLGAGTSILATVTDPQSIAMHPTGKFLYVAGKTSSLVKAYSINTTDGTLTYLSSAATGSNILWMRIHHNGKFAYAIHSDTITTALNVIHVYTIDQNTGALTSTGTTYLTGNDPRSTEIHISGNYLYTAVFNANTIRTYTIDQTTGALSNPVDKSTAMSSYSIALHPSGNYAYLVGGGTSVQIYTINTATGGLTLLNTVSNGANAGNRITVDSSGYFVYSTAWASVYSNYIVNQTTGDLGSAVLDTSTGGTNPNMIVTTGAN